MPPSETVYLSLLILYLAAGLAVIWLSKKVQKDFWLEHKEHNKTTFFVILLLWPFAIYGMIRNHTNVMRKKDD